MIKTNAKGKDVVVVKSTNSDARVGSSATKHRTDKPDVLLC